MISLSLDLSFAGGDDLGTGSSGEIETDSSIGQWFNQPGVLSSSSSSESTLRFFDLGEGGSGRLESESQGVTIFNNSYRMGENSRLLLSGVQ